jgi:hypothetical protein
MRDINRISDLNRISDFSISQRDSPSDPILNL